MTKTIKVAKKDVKKFEELISDFNKWMKENTPLEKEKMKSKKENIKDCLDMCLSLSDDKNYHKMIKKLTHNERVCFLLDNGFEFDLPEEESKELESLYRKSIAKKDL